MWLRQVKTKHEENSLIKIQELALYRGGLGALFWWLGEFVVYKNFSSTNLSANFPIILKKVKYLE